MRHLTVPIDSIIVNKRTRKGEGAIETIASSAKTFMGQIQSLAVKDLGDGKYELLAGACRLAAFKRDGISEVLIRIYENDLTEAQAKEIELVENLARADLPWQESVALTQEIHDLNMQTHSDATSSSEEWSKTKTAELLGVDRSTVSRDLDLAHAISKVPELAKCKFKKDAKAVLGKVEEMQLVAELAKREEQKTVASGGIDAQRKELMNSYVLGDSFELMETLPDETINLIDCDPDYAIDFDNTVDIRPGSKEMYELARKSYQAVGYDGYEGYLHKLAEVLYRKLTPNGWMLFWHSSYPHVGIIQSALEEAGFELQTPAIWYKKAGGRTAQPDKKMQKAYESFFYCRKGSALLRHRMHQDVFVHSRAGRERAHPAEKPRALMRDILSVFSFPGQRVLVPFAGSGNSIFAAADLGMKAIGFDSSEVYRAYFVERAAQWFPEREEIHEAALKLEERKNESANPA